jgi:hypothetical protein
MTTESYPHQKRVRAMGTALAVISSLALLASVLTPVALFMFPSWLLGFDNSEGLTYFERLAGEKVPDPQTSNDEELRSYFEARFETAQPDLPKGTTREIFANTMIYFLRMQAGETLFLPEEVALNETVDPDFPDFSLLPAGLTADSPIRELILKDRAFFEAHAGRYRLLAILTAAFFSIVSLVVLRMALAWRRKDPFGPGTIHGLRWLGFLFLVQFIARFVAVAVVPDSGFSELSIHSAMFDEFSSGDGASLTCAIMFLTLSWVLEYGRNMKEEQALTI